MYVPFPVIVAGHAAATVVFAVVLQRSLRTDAASKARRPWARRIAASVALGVIALSAYAWIVEPRRLVLHEETIPSRAFHGAPLRIAAIGDVHIGGPHMSLSRVDDVVARVNALDAELIVLLGDYIDGHGRLADRSADEQADLASGIAKLGALRAPLGVVAVVGNHDVWYDRDAVVGALDAARIRVLENAHVVLERADGSKVVVAGLEDATTMSPDYAAALAGAPAGADWIVLTHSPDPFAGSPDGIALTLAAHTHCGQVLVPFLGRPVTPSIFGQRYACGRVVENGEPMFVTAGLGTSILPVRFLTPPEIALVTLRPS